MHIRLSFEIVLAKWFGRNYDDFQLIRRLLRLRVKLSQDLVSFRRFTSTRYRQHPVGLFTQHFSQ